MTPQPPILDYHRPQPGGSRTKLGIVSVAAGIIGLVLITPVQLLLYHGIMRRTLDSFLPLLLTFSWISAIFAIITGMRGLRRARAEGLPAGKARIGILFGWLAVAIGFIASFLACL